MHSITSDAEMRAIMEKAHVMRAEATRAFFAKLFTRKPREEAQVTAQTA